MYDVLGQKKLTSITSNQPLNLRPESKYRAHCPLPRSLACMAQRAAVCKEAVTVAVRADTSEDTETDTIICNGAYLR